MDIRYDTIGGLNQWIYDRRAGYTILERLDILY
jgi:hypothetical protein